MASDVPVVHRPNRVAELPKQVVAATKGLGKKSILVEGAGILASVLLYELCKLSIRSNRYPSVFYDLKALADALPGLRSENDEHDFLTPIFVDHLAEEGTDAYPSLVQDVRSFLRDRMGAGARLVLQADSVAVATSVFGKSFVAELTQYCTIVQVGVMDDRGNEGSGQGDSRGVDAASNRGRRRHRLV